MRSRTRRHVLSLFAAALCVAPSVHAQANWPTRTIHMIVPLAAGSAVDAAARIVAEKMGRNMGQSILIENKRARRD
jgi:tripartite-type tricarboxylate transporter receptor subunit TctC